MGKVGALLFKRKSEAEARKERLNRVDARSRSGPSEAKPQRLGQEGVREAVGGEQAGFPTGTAASEAAAEWREAGLVSTQWWSDFRQQQGTVEYQLQRGVIGSICLAGVLPGGPTHRE